VRVGFIGLGRMGKPMCARLVAAGHEVTASDLATGSPAEAAAAADVLFTMLPGPGEVREATGEALPSLRPGSTWIDTSTCSPRVGRELVEEAARRGVRCLDAPVAGGPRAAEAGALQLFVGGDAAVLDEHRELLGALAERVLHVGGNGAGYTTKLLVNLLWFGQAVAVTEAFLLGRRAGLEADVLRAAIEGSAAASEFVRSDLDAPLAGDYLPSFGIDRCLEELEAVGELARELSVPLEVGQAVERVHRRAVERFGAVDGELLAVALLEEEAGLRLRAG
jgi:3-hydroxyisobutyrate dehydrogenase